VNGEETEAGRIARYRRQEQMEFDGRELDPTPHARHIFSGVVFAACAVIWLAQHFLPNLIAVPLSGLTCVVMLVSVLFWKWKIVLLVIALVIGHWACQLFEPRVTISRPAMSAPTPEVKQAHKPLRPHKARIVSKAGQ
jgi:type III secretory pathway component EscU